MANKTIFPNAIDDLSWSSSGQDTAETTAENTVVLNSSGARVYWTEGANSGSFTNGKNLNCNQGPITKIWGFSDQSAGAAKITLTVTGSGGGAPPPAAQGHGAGGKKA